MRLAVIVGIQLLVIGMFIYFADRISLIPPVFLPKAVHNTVGNTPIVETLDDEPRNWGHIQTISYSVISSDSWSGGPTSAYSYRHGD